MATGVSLRSGSLMRFEMTRTPVCGPAFGFTVATAPDLASLADGAAAGAANGDCSATPLAGDCVGVAASCRFSRAARSQMAPAIKAIRQSAATASRRASAFAVVDEAGGRVRPGLLLMIYNPFVPKAAALPPKPSTRLVMC
jgi:hypothetical protein